jgi:cell division protein FtsB
MSHDHCDCVEGLEEHIAWQRDRGAEQDARGLRLAGEVDDLRQELLVERELRRWFAAKAREHGFDDTLAKAERLREELDISRVDAEEYREENERLRDEIADLTGDGFPDALADQPTEGVIAEDISP